MNITLYDYCVQQGHSDLMAQWHPLKNSDKTPHEVKYGSHYLAWWFCDKNHEWQAQVNSRVHGAGCPICSNRLLKTGVNDLATTYPELAAQWHPVKNGVLTPDRVVFGNRDKVWWLCEKGHEWQARIESRTRIGTGCPICARKVIVPGENDLASLFPEIASQWHPDKNGVLTPQHFPPYSNRRAWWQCKFGHEWQTTIASRTSRGTSCPYCSGRKVLPGFNDLTTTEPKVAAEWHSSLNGDLTPEMVSMGSNKMVWWECAEGHVWKAVIYSRTGKRRSGCPICAGSIKKERAKRYRLALGDQLSRTHVKEDF